MRGETGCGLSELNVPKQRKCLRSVCWKISFPITWDFSQLKVQISVKCKTTFLRTFVRRIGSEVISGWSACRAEKCPLHRTQKYHPIWRSCSHKSRLHFCGQDTTVNNTGVGTAFLQRPNVVEGTVSLRQTQWEQQFPGGGLWQEKGKLSL